jgi:NTE family protein
MEVAMASDFAIVLGGGGARAAYQAGVLRRLGQVLPDLKPAILVGASAGAINAAYLAAHPGSFREATEGLARLWSTLRAEQVFRVTGRWLFRNVARWTVRLMSGGWRHSPQARALLDSAPLRSLLDWSLGADGGELVGIARNLETGRLRAAALTTIDYTTGETVAWVQGCGIQNWERPLRRSVKTRLTVDHVLASAALPWLFPAVALGGRWHGDGGVRLHAPLAPAIHLGANRILALSTRWRPPGPLDSSVSVPYPPPAQVAGILLNAIFVDLIDEDAMNARRMNRLLAGRPPAERHGLRPIDVLVVRPSQDLAGLAPACEPCLPPALRFMMRGLGTGGTAAPDFLSLLMFEPEYLRRVVEIGERDAQAHLEAIGALATARGQSGIQEHALYHGGIASRHEYTPPTAGVPWGR